MSAMGNDQAHVDAHRIQNVLHKMNLPTNFQPAPDGWFHIAPHGTFPHPNGALQVIDAEACEAMLGTFREEAKQPNFPGLLVDFDHSSHDPAQPTTAAGWIAGLEHRGDGLYAQIRWSDLGHQALTGGRYRLVSPVWNRADCEQWSAPAPDGREMVHLRPRRLDRLALTNDPNLPGLMPLSNRKEEGPAAEAAFSGASSPTREGDPSPTVGAPSPGGRRLATEHSSTSGLRETTSSEPGQQAARTAGTEPPGTAAITNKTVAGGTGFPATATTTMNLRSEILQRLHLGATATDAEIAEALRRQTDELDTLRNRCQRLTETQAESDLERFADVITNRDVVRAQLVANRESTLALLNALRQPEPPAPLHQPRLRRPNLQLLSPLSYEPDPASARRVANRARQLQSQLKIGHHAAFRMAEGEAADPELA
jgi:hypothetical protein